MRRHTALRGSCGLFAVVALLAHLASAETAADEGFAITQIVRGSGSGAITLTWTSNQGESYNIENYLRGAYWNGQEGNVTTVGSGGPGSASYYGSFDMGGNVRGWNEQEIFGFRGQRGGSWGGNSNNLQSSNRDVGLPTLRLNFIGFRVAGP
jgi:formylglycine-generating enzyme required for sulfatase activity